MPTVVQKQGVAVAPEALRAVTRAGDVMLGALRKPAAELSVLLCGNRQIHALNRAYRGKNKPTDVLAFSQREGAPMHGDALLLGDVVISMPTARRQARERGRSLIEEVMFLLAHGVLHLEGYDHQTDAEERRMNARADVLLGAVARQSRGKRRPARGAPAVAKRRTRGK